jgi:hypothetical protein
MGIIAHIIGKAINPIMMLIANAEVADHLAHLLTTPFSRHATR